MTRHLIAIVAAMLVAGVCARADASIITIAEVNNTPGTAQNVDLYFSLDFSPDIGDAAGTNTSLFIPHVTVDATGTHASNYPELDWYSFTVPFAGAVGIFDIDYGRDVDEDDGFFDSNLQLLDVDGSTELAFSDDSAVTEGAGGSAYEYDSFIEYMFTAAGVYYIGVGRCCGMEDLFAYGTTEPTYQLQISIDGHALEPVPEPATFALLGTGLAVVAGRMTRCRASRV